MTSKRKSRGIEGFSSLLEQWPYIRYLGMGAWWAWIWICYSSLNLFGNYEPSMQTGMPLLMYLASTCGIAASMIVAALFWKRFTAFVDNGRAVIGSSIVAGIATFVLGYAAFMPNTVTVFIIAAVLTGMGTSMLCLRCGRIYGSIAMRESLTSGALSLIFAAFLFYTCVALSGFWRILFTSFMPILSAMLMMLPGEDSFPASSGNDLVVTGAKAPGMRSYRRLVAASAIVAFTAGVGMGIASVTLSPESFSAVGINAVFFVVLLAICIVAMVNYGDIVHAVRWIYAALMVLGVAILMLCCFGLDLAYLFVGKETLWMIFSCLMAYMVFRFDFSPIKVFGVGQAVYFLSSTAAWACGRVVVQQVQIQGLGMVIAVFFSFLIILVFAVVFNDSDIKFILTWRGKESPAGASSAAQDANFSTGQAAAGKPAAIDAAGGLADADACAVGPDGGAAPAGAASDAAASSQINPAKAYGLSDREMEILDLFAQGRSANWISDYLFISKNTVRSHLRAIYTKMDVHTRQELLDKLGRS